MCRNWVFVQQIELICILSVHASMMLLRCAAQMLCSIFEKYVLVATVAYYKPRRKSIIKEIQC